MSERTTQALRGASRIKGYAEREAEEPGEVLAPADTRQGEQRQPVPEPPPGPPALLHLQPKRREVPARWGWRGHLARATAGMVKLSPSSQESAHRQALGQIRTATWPRAVNVMVTNPKGGVGKTPTALLLAGILGHVRGGYVVAWEAAESVGTLTSRSEGTPGRGLAELLAHRVSVTSAGSLGAFTAPQTSHADVIGSVGGRAVLSADDILAVREVLDTYYRITVTDTGNNPQHPAYLAALRTADVVVVPCLVSLDSLAKLEEVLALIAVDPACGAAAGFLLNRVVVVLGHDGGPEDSHISAGIRQRLGELDAVLVEVPYDPAIRQGGQITLADLTEASTRAWTSAAAAVVEALATAPTHTDLVARARAVTPRPTQEKRS